MKWRNSETGEDHQDFEEQKEKAMEVDTRKFLGWLNHAGPGDIQAMLTRAGHEHPDYQAEQVKKCFQNKILFAWKWYDDITSYYVAVNGELFDPV